MNDLYPHTLTLTSIIVSIGISLLVGVFVSYISALLLWLTPEQKLSAFIVGFALMCTLAIAQISPPGNEWNVALMLYSLPLLAAFVYFLPTIAATSMECEIFRSVFLVNLFFGWSGIGWIAAMLMAFRPEERDIYGDLSYRLTPFGVVPRTQIGYGSASRVPANRA